MVKLSENENLEIDWNYAYARKDLCDYMNIKYVKEEIERIVYQPPHYSTIIIFSTINNVWGYIYGKISDTEFIITRTGNLPYHYRHAITSHQSLDKELLLFIRKDDSTGFYYFGRCKYSYEYRSENYPIPFCCLNLLDTNFSDARVIEIPDLSE